MDINSLIGKRFTWKEKEFCVVNILVKHHLLAEDEDRKQFTFNLLEQAESAQKSIMPFVVEREGVYGYWHFMIDSTPVDLQLTHQGASSLGRVKLSMLFDAYTHTILAMQ